MRRFLRGFLPLVLLLSIFELYAANEENSTTKRINNGYSWILPYHDDNNSILTNKLFALAKTTFDGSSSILLSYWGLKTFSSVTTYASFIIDEIQNIGGTQTTDIIILNSEGVVKNKELVTGEEYIFMCINLPGQAGEFPTYIYIGDEKIQIAPNNVVNSSPFMGEIIIPYKTYVFKKPGDFVLSCGEPSFFNDVQKVKVKVSLKREPLTREELIAMIAEGKDVTNVDVSQITDMSLLMIDVAKYLGKQEGKCSVVQNFNQDIGNWDVSNVQR